ncbi:transcriptional regulator BolA [Candidatus Ishikawella capsulata]|nr:transcriptional regulator BolA [Candidatus Ishikawaella capsulata]
MIREQITEKLHKAFEPIYLEVHNESYRHNVPAGSESHFKVIIVSDIFMGQKLLDRHRSIYKELIEELAESVYALALHTYTTKEWTKINNTIIASPNCRADMRT